ncbi:histidine kinase dimerization/phospho-acceptor domain-containing protein [Shigella flexneri]
MAQSTVQPHTCDDRRERRFTSDAAHELRSPLTALKVQTGVCAGSDDDRRRQKKHCSNYIPGWIALRLVNQLLALSQLDSLDNLQEHRGDAA